MILIKLNKKQISSQVLRMKNSNNTQLKMKKISQKINMNKLLLKISKIKSINQSKRINKFKRNLMIYIKIFKKKNKIYRK